MLKERLIKLQRVIPAETSIINEFEISDDFSRHLGETIVQGQRVGHLLKRIEGTSTLVLASDLSLLTATRNAQADHKQQFRTILDFRGLENARQDSDIMVELSKKAQRDGRALKTITLLTLVYLPATFVAVCYSVFFVLTGRMAC